ncbi:MAG: hypothetical protein KC546_21045 [Anaerolineae bacterium]|nr:hypothetical protein [Anaerolineae bacterium]MCA9890884.1 hypothetical protein [Anaerolineae bacterium]MCA9894785.1 hypothetical protein [Anaerolineae bacterium]MCB9459352.1 hypothetical protein [Anaerolineaceae bacterium]
MEYIFLGSGVLLVILLRSVLIVMGVHKDPVLRSFEKYGEESQYSPFIVMLIWGYIFIAYHLIIFVPSPGLFVIMLVISAILINAIFINPSSFVYRLRPYFNRFPRWFVELSQRTTREERRRIAYLWLRLPIRTRILYNTHDYYFLEWADLVLLSIAR